MARYSVNRRRSSGKFNRQARRISVVNVRGGRGGVRL